MAAVTDDLNTWFRAQLDDNERWALAASDGYPNWSATDDGTVCQDGTGGSGYLATGPWGSDLGDVGQHIALHDPARVLADVEADRQLLDAYEAAIQPTDEHDPKVWGYRTGLEYAVRTRAQAYVGNPGYRKEWQPWPR